MGVPDRDGALDRRTCDQLGPQPRAEADLTAWERGSRHETAAKVTGLVSLLLWIGIVVAGRWIAYAA